MSRLIIVSNRLPFRFEDKDEGDLKLIKGDGGLVSAVESYLDSLGKDKSDIDETLWVGWPGIVPKEKEKEIRSKAFSEFKSCPVFIPEDEADDFYHGFCNSTIWPLYHYFSSYVVYNKKYWESYKRANERFCEVLLKILKPGDIVWVHDYHLMLLPKMLRENMPELKIGFFLHIPFPSYELFRLLPRDWSKDILKGMLGADLLGFHTHTYTQYFLRCVLRFIGSENLMGRILYNNRLIRADTFPISIDYQKFKDAAESAEVIEEGVKLKKSFDGLRIIYSLDRLDYTKGMLNRLHGYEKLLEKNLNLKEKVVFVMTAVPSRVEVDKYQELKNEIERCVGRINGRFGNTKWTPIIYQYKNIPFTELVAYYKYSDIALITPIRDGMNLVAKEYVACKSGKTGVLILSEMAGAADELREAVLIDPNNILEIADALKEALEMPVENQIEKNEIMQKRIRDYDVSRWADSFVKSLIEVKLEQKRLDAKKLNFEQRKKIIKEYNNAKSRLIFLDYDGTLVPFASDPDLAKPSEKVLNTLNILMKDPLNEVVLITGRGKDTLENWFGYLKMHLVAEHGAWIKEHGSLWNATNSSTVDWKTRVKPLLEIYRDRLLGSFLEEKDFSLVFHYRNSDVEQSSRIVRELKDILNNFTINADIQLLPGNKVLEIRNAGANKGTAAAYFLSKKKYDFIMAVGDDFTDEFLFNALPEKAYSIKVGLSQTSAHFSVNKESDVIKLLRKLILNKSIQSHS